MNDSALTVSGPTQLPVLVVPSEILAEIDRLLAVPALMAKCTTQGENKAVFEARRDIENLSRKLEKARKKITDPVNDWLRQVKAVVDTAKAPLDREAGRLANLEKDFKLADDRRIREEQEAQQRELDRIEREKRMEVARLAREQADREAEARRAQEEADRQVRLAQEAADRAAREATDQKQRDAAKAQADEAARMAELNRVANLNLAEVQRKENEKLTADMAAAQEKSDAEAAIAAKPIERTRETGQTARRVWKITTIDVWKLVAVRPDLVREILPDRMKITECLNRGEKVAGVTAEEDYSMGARGGRKPQFVDV